MPYRVIYRERGELKRVRDLSSRIVLRVLIDIAMRYGEATAEYQKWLGYWKPLIYLNLKDREMAYYEIVTINKQTRQKETKRFRTEDHAFKFFFSINGGTPARAYVCSWNYRRLIGRIVKNDKPQSEKDKRRYLHQWGDQLL